MARQNRVLPTGEIVAHAARGMFMGNRGILHDENGKLGTARWRIQGWVTCSLVFKSRKRQLMQPGHYTELFFFDEAVALAAGHRPCAECRRADYLSFKQAAGVSGTIAAFDRRLHTARVHSGTRLQKRIQAEIRELPDGTFILDDAGKPCLIHEGQLWRFSLDGYVPNPEPLRGLGKVVVLTPEPTLAALREGYTPVVLVGG